jgi:hypothetical protein
MARGGNGGTGGGLHEGRTGGGRSFEEWRYGTVLQQGVGGEWAVEQGEGRPGGCGRKRKEGEPGKATREAGSTEEDRGAMTGGREWQRQGWCRVLAGWVSHQSRNFYGSKYLVGLKLMCYRRLQGLMLFYTLKHPLEKFEKHYIWSTSIYF